MTVEKMELLTKFAEQNRSGAQGCFMDYDTAQALALAIDAALAALRSSAVGNLSRVEMDNIHLGRRLEAAEAHIEVLEARGQP